MRKYTLKRLESLAIATSLTFTLTACGGHESNKNAEVYDSHIAASNDNKEDAIISEYKLEKGHLSEKIAELKEELDRRKKEIERLEKIVDNYSSLISVEKAYKLLDESDLFDIETKEFIKSYLNDKSDAVVVSLLLQAITGDSRYLVGYINEENSHAPLAPNYNSADLFILDNTRGIISDYYALYVSLEYSSTYGNYSVYETPFGFVIANSNNRVVAYTTLEGKIVSVSSLNISLVPFNKFLENIGLSSYIAPVYLPENLERAKLAVNKKIAGYQENDKKRTSNVLVIDMASCKEYNHIGEHEPYYFLDYIGPDVFNTSSFLCQDIFNSDAYFTLDKESGEFLYQYPDYYSTNRGFYLTEYDFSLNPLKTLSELLDEKNMSEALGHKTVLNNSELCDIYSALNPEEPTR